MCVHSVLRDTVLRVLVGGGGGGGVCSSTGELVLAVEVRVARFVGDALTGDSVGAGGSGKGFGWFLVATIVALSIEERRFNVCVLSYVFRRKEMSVFRREEVTMFLPSLLLLIYAYQKGYFTRTLNHSDLARAEQPHVGIPRAILTHLNVDIVVWWYDRMIVG